MMKSSTPIVCLMGPTSSGKTRLAMQLASRFPCRVISVDSAMVYRGMDIGTAKPTREEQAHVPHYLIDICDPLESYSAGQFRQDALREIQTAFDHGEIPLLVGGTMLYFRRLQIGLADLPTADEALRKKINADAEQYGWSKVYEELKKMDPETAKFIHPNDAQRIQRALEIIYLTGKTVSQLRADQKEGALPFPLINLILAPNDRTLLHQRIEKRFENMLAQGFLEEVLQLFNRGDLHADLPAIRAVGYRQAWGYFNQEYDFKAFKEKAVAATRQLAKRQYTWLRSWPEAEWFNSEDQHLLDRIMKRMTSISR